jgi:predicted lipoprotein with Yx(FWY)xxD motif
LRPATSGRAPCYDEYANDWPPVVIAGIEQIAADLAPNLGLSTRQDGRQQVTYQGMPLYRYAADRAPGDMRGQGLGNVWFVVWVATP